MHIAHSEPSCEGKLWRRPAVRTVIKGRGNRPPDP